MRKIIILLWLLFISTGLSAQTISVSYKQEAWDLGNKLSQAALINAMSNDSALTSRTFSSASTNAKSLGIVLPGLPPKSNDKIKDNADALFYLLNTTGKPIMNILTKGFGAEHAALFEIAFKTNVLLMLYDPDGKETAAIVGVINKRSETAGLPPSVFSELMKLINNKAGYDAVKNEIFQLQKTVSAFVASNEFSENGSAFYEQKEYAKSVAEFSKALQISPDEPKFYFLRGRSQMQNNKFTEAIADYTKVIQFTRSEIEKTNLPTTYYNRGLCYGLLKKFTQALPDLTMAIRLNPDKAAYYKTRSLVYKQLGNLKLAESDYLKAESLQPGIMGN